MWASPSQHDYLLKAPLPNTITLAVTISTYAFFVCVGGERKTQTFSPFNSDTHNSTFIITSLYQFSCSPTVQEMLFGPVFHRAT